MIDDLLKNIDVPESLKDNLRAIPDRAQPEPTKPSSPFRRRARWAIALAVAASLAFVAAISWQAQIEPPEQVTQADPPAVRIGPDEPTGDGLETEIEELELLQLELQQLRLETEITRLRQQQAFGSNRNRSQTATIESTDFKQEKLALIRGLVCQASIEWGAPIESVRPELQQVVGDFAGTQGAEIAKQLLNQYE